MRIVARFELRLLGPNGVAGVLHRILQALHVRLQGGALRGHAGVLGRDRRVFQLALHLLQAALQTVHLANRLVTVHDRRFDGLEFRRQRPV